MVMKITQLQIQNFRQIEDLSISSLPNSLAVFGPMGAGKSSILAAVQYTLLGHCGYTDKRGAGYRDLIRTRCDYALISLELDAAIAVECGIYPDKSDWACVSLETGETYAKDRDDLLGKLGIPRKFANICLRPDAFILGDSDFGSVLAGFLGEVDPAALRNACTDDQWAWLIEFQAKHRVGPFDDITNLDAIGQIAYNQRTAEKRSLAEARLDLDSRGHAPSGVTIKTEKGVDKRYTTNDLPAVRATLETLDTQRRQLERERGAAEIAVSADKKAARVAEAQEVVNIAKADANTADAAYKAAQEAAGTAQANLSDAKTSEANAVYRREQAAKTCTTATRNLKELEAWTDCPTCGAKITDARRKSLTAGLQQAVADAEAALEAAKVECAARVAALEPLRKALAAADNESEAARKAALDANKAVTSAETVFKAAKELPVASRSVDEIAASISAIEDKRARGQNLLAELEKIEAHENAAATVALIETRVAMLEWAVKSFRDGAISKRFLHTEALLSRVNAELRDLGYEMSIEVDGKTVRLLLAGGADTIPRPLPRRSNGERTLACAALALAFADTVGIVCIDDLNDMDANVRRAFLGRMRTHQVQTALLACAWQSNKPFTPTHAEALKPTTALWLEHGTAAA